MSDKNAQIGSLNVDASQQNGLSQEQQISQQAQTQTVSTQVGAVSGQASVTPASQQEGISPQNGTPPVVKLKVTGCEVRLVRDGDVHGVLEDVNELLVRYGRMERKQVIDEYRQALSERSLKVDDVPVLLVTVNSVESDKKCAEFISNDTTGRVPVNVDGASMELKPEVIHYGGLDASKPVSEVDPKQYLVLPFQVRYGDPGRGIVIPREDFEAWAKKIPRG